MKIGIFCGAIGHGGSQNTTASVALALAGRGHSVTLYVDKARFRSFEDIGALEVVDLPRHLLSSPVWGDFSIRNAIRTVRAIQRNRCDITLCVGSGHIPIAVLISVLFKIPCFFYAVGKSKSPTLRFFHGTIIANCEETQDSFVQWLKRCPETIPVVRARINLSVFQPSVRVNSNSGMVKAITMSRLEFGKSKGIIIIMKAIHKLNKKGKKISLDIFGDGLAMSELRPEAGQINVDIGTNVITLRGATDSVQSELPRYDVAFGIGRCAWEPMACGIPTIVVGKEGLGGIVCSENLSKLIWHNFTARGIDKKSDFEEVADALQTLVDDPNYRKTLGDYALQVVRKYYDVKRGAEQLEQIIRKTCLGGSERYSHSGSFLIAKLLFFRLCHSIKCLAKCILRPRESLHALQNLRLRNR